MRTAALTLALAALAAAAPARAQYAPPGMTFGPPASTPPAAPDPVAAATAAAPAVFAAPAPYSPPYMTFGPAAPPPIPEPPRAETGPSPWEWAFGAGAGPGRKGPWGGEDGRGPAVVIELSLVRREGASLVGGVMLSLPAGALAVAGWRVGLSPALRLDLLADAGVMDLGVRPNETEWAPAAGARAGLSWLSTRRRRYLMLAAAVRGAWGRSETWCDVATHECFRDRRGGTFLGAVLTYGSVGAVPGPAGDRLEGGR